MTHSDAGNQPRRSIRPRPDGHLVLLLALGVVLAGCAQSAAQSPTDVPTGKAAEMGQLLGSVHQDLYLMDRAVDRVIEDCMAQQGWEYFPLRVDAADASHEAVYTLQHELTPQEAAEQGYGFYIEQRRDSPIPARAANQEYRRGLTEQQRRAYQEDLDGGPDAEAQYGEGIGGPTEGCLVEARKQLHGPQWQQVSMLSYKLQTLGNKALQRVGSDQRLTDALDAWRGCMGDAGFEVDRPSAAVERFFDPASQDSEESSQPVGHDPSQAEIELAVADAECRKQVELHQTWTEVVRRQRANVAAENPDMLDQWAELRATYLPNIRELLGDDIVDAVLDA